MILIDRLAPDTDLGIATRLLRGNDWEAEIADNRWYSTSTVVSEDGESSRNNIRISLSMAKSRSARYEDPLALQPVTEANALQIVKDWSKSKWTQDAEMRVRETLQADDQLARPLFAALIGDAIRTDDLPRGVLNPVTVASAALERLFRRHDEKSDSYSEQAKILLAAATVGQGLPEDELFDDNKILCDLIGETHLSDTGMKELKRRVQKFAGSCSSQEIPPVEPDFLGGLFVLERLLSLSRKRALPKADLIMSIAWKLGRNPGAFVVRLAADFIGRGEQVAAAVAR